jgi:toxin ParE1/3/4
VSRYVLSVAAELDLNQIWDFIAEDNINAADRWIETLFDALATLALNPGIGHKREDLTNLPIHFWPVGAYLIPYRVKDKRVEILAITQGARDIPVFLSQRMK